MTTQRVDFENNISVSCLLEEILVQALKEAVAKTDGEMQEIFGGNAYDKKKKEETGGRKTCQSMAL